MVSALLYKLLYFVQFCGFGILSPYMPIFYESLEFTKSQIGILSMMPNVCAFLIAPVFGFIGDKFNVHGEVLVTAMFTSTLTTIASLYMTTFWTQLPLVLVTSILRSPIGPGIDALVMASLQDKTTYGAMRLWGAVSFGFCSLLGGYLTSARHTQQDEDSPFVVLFYAYAMATVLSGYIILCLLYEETNRAKEDYEQDKRATSSMELVHNDTNTVNGDSDDFPAVGQPTGSNTAMIAHLPGSNSGGAGKGRGIIDSLLRVVREKPIILLFAAVVFLSGFGAGAIDSYLFLRLKELGGSGVVMGIGRFITCAAEVPMFHVAGRLQKSYGTWPMIALTQFAFVVRFVYYVLLRNPWAVLPCEALNGLTFAVTWSVSCTYANEIAPPGCHAVVQALLEGLHFGIGCGVGSLVGGFIYDYYGAVRLFEICAVLSALSTALAVCVWWTCPQAGMAAVDSDAGGNAKDVQARARPAEIATAMTELVKVRRVDNAYTMLGAVETDDDSERGAMSQIK